MSRALVGNLEAEVKIVRRLRLSKQLAFLAHFGVPLIRNYSRSNLRLRFGFSWDAIVARQSTKWHQIAAGQSASRWSAPSDRVDQSSPIPRPVWTTCKLNVLASAAKRPVRLAASTIAKRLNSPARAAKTGGIFLMLRRVWRSSQPEISLGRASNSLSHAAHGRMLAVHVPML